MSVTGTGYSDDKAFDRLNEARMEIKQTYLSMITGIDKNKLSRLLTGSQGESGADMEIIAEALGKM